MKKALLTLTFSCMFGATLPAQACTTIIVGKGATTDNSIIVARNVDERVATSPQNPFRHPAQTEKYQFISNFPNNSNHSVFSWEMPPNTLGYFAFPQWDTFNKHNPSFDEIGVNGYGVTISATETLFNSARVLAVDPYTLSGITEDAITSVILAQATSASNGILRLGEIIEQVGAGEGFGVAIADRNEAWYLESASGHHWVAQRIPDNAVFVSANQGRFQDINFDDTMSVMSSPNIREFMAEKGLYNPADGPLNLFKCCMRDLPGDTNYNAARVAKLLTMYSGSADKNKDGQYPLFPEPSRKLSKDDIAAGLRNHYDGSKNDPYQTQNPNEPLRPISVMRTSISHITQVFPDLPLDIAVVQYIALGMTDLSAYIPFFQGFTKTPSAYQGATDTADDQSLFWKYRKVQALVMQDYPKYAPATKAALKKLESKIARDREDMVQAYLKEWYHNENLAKAIIDEFTAASVIDQIDLLSDLIHQLESAQGKIGMNNTAYTQMLEAVEKKYHFAAMPGLNR